MRLLDHAKNIYSQSGEDGILAAILGTIGITDKWCVEFGAGMDNISATRATLWTTLGIAQ